MLGHAATRLDSESWTCRGCGGPFIGHKPATLTCAPCSASASGPCATSPVTAARSAAPAVQVLEVVCTEAGITLSNHDKRVLAVLAGPEFCSTVANLIMRAAAADE